MPRSMSRLGAIVRFVRWRVNRPLVLGMVLIIAVIVVAVMGPRLAPRDPLEETNILKVGGEWITPPFPAFRVPGYPLGSDAFGRDLLSRLLWAVRPTMVMVVTVSAVRLTLGVIIGLVSGWSEGRLAGLLRSLTAGALSIPTLIVALVSIAAIGVEWGIWAFVIGLSITGWAATAQSVREKTRELRGEAFVEAARALGCNRSQILFGHLLRHVMPMVWMLMAFEVGNTLTVTGSLGFLGYFIGGDVWIEVGDFVARRVSGAPELGQMLATAQISLLEPWAMFAVGTVIFVSVLGFHLLGEGLRRRLALEQSTKRTLYGLVVSDLAPWLRRRFVDPSIAWARSHPLSAGASVVVLMGATVGLVAWRALSGPNARATLTTTEHLWASDWHDAYGTMHTGETGPRAPQILWTFETQEGIAGGPAVASDGTLYLGGRAGSLYALTPTGELLWSTSLPTATVGAPALGNLLQGSFSPGDGAGILYVADVEGAIAAVSGQGEVIWRHLPEVSRTATSGPIVSRDGTVYLGFGSNIQALAPDGHELWTIPTPYGLHILPPHLSADDRWLFRQDLIVDAATGQIVAWPATEGVDGYITGEDGQQYAMSGNVVMTLSVPEDAGAGGSVDVVQTTRWDSGAFTFAEPRYAGVTQDQVIWLGYASLRNGIVVWLSPDGRVYNRAQTDPLQRATLIGLDGASTAYLCGPRASGALRCFSLSIDEPDPRWTLDLGEDSNVVGGAIATGRLYVATREGTLFALGDE